MDAEGWFYFVDRKKNTIVSSYKILPREVEDALYARPAVREAAHCRRGLAAYKVPRRVEILEEPTKTAGGRMLRRELRARANSRT